MSTPTPADAITLARTAGLRELRIPRLEEVDRRRAQLWGLSLLVAIGIPVVVLLASPDVLPPEVFGSLDVRTVRLALVAMLVAVMGYVAEREVTLRRLTGLLVEERVLTASLVNRVDELNLLLRATRAMNSALDLTHVLAQIAESAHALLHADGVALWLVDPEDASSLVVATSYGRTPAYAGQRQAVGEGLAGKAAAQRDALLAGAQHQRSRTAGAAIAVPLELRGQLVGVLTVHGGEEREAFTEFDLRSVSVFADASAAAISNARAYEEQLGQVADLLEADQAKDEFLTLVTHELRTPLTSMIGLLTTMSRRAGSLTPNQVTEFAGIARAQGWRLDRLIGDLLDAAKDTRRALEVHPEVTAVHTILGASVRAVAATAPDRTITFESDGELVRALDPDALLRITDNLLSNAIKYTPEGSPVEVRLREEVRGVRIDVVDHGPGIDPEQRAALFEKFTRGPDPHSRGGLGLGLYVVQALAEAHAGRVEVTQTPGGGATVSVWVAAWPVTVRETDQPERHAEP